MEKEERIEQIKKRMRPNWCGFFTEQQKQEAIEKTAEKIFEREKKLDRLNEQVNLIAANRQRKNRELGLKEHTLKWTIESMKIIKDMARFYTQEGFGAPQPSWKSEILLKKPIDSLRAIIAYLYVKLFYYG